MDIVLGLRRSAWGLPLGRLAALAALAPLLLVLPRLRPASEAPAPAPPGSPAAALGSAEQGAPLERRPADGVEVGLTPSGYAVSLDAGASAALVFETAGEWQRFEGGAFRPTEFGSETVTIGPRLTEQYLTVERRPGLRTWRWRIDAPGLEPVLARSGRVDLVSPAGPAELFIPAVAVSDVAGQNAP